MEKIKSDFPFFRNHKDLVYLDSAATTFMPDCVIQRWTRYHSEIGVSTSRSKGFLGVLAEKELENARNVISDFFSASLYHTVFTKNATESLNLAAHTLEITAGDVILIGPYEHHSNLLVWERLALAKDAIVVALPVVDGAIIYDAFVGLTSLTIKVIAISIVSNIMGDTIDLRRLFKLYKTKETVVVLDITQAAAHNPPDLDAYNVDFVAVSAHKMYGPKNIGACFINKKTADTLTPFMLGGGMVWSATGRSTTWATGSAKFEAGTFDIGLVCAWAEACLFLSGLNIASVRKIENQLSLDLLRGLREIEHIDVLNGDVADSPIRIFDSPLIHPHDFETFLSRKGVIIRVGHMCSQNTLSILGKTALCRCSIGVYNNSEDMEKCLLALRVAGRGLL
ncbi:cysteine desulfurase [Synergistales bacterium]|nr:cysteine desulfurase [Synergistales bacterium]